MSKGWDLTSRNSLNAAAEWIRKDSKALFVLVIRGEDMVFRVDDKIAPADAVAMVDYVLPGLKDQLAEERRQAKDEAERKRKDAPMPCGCAKLFYRNNRDGTQDKLVKGEASCSLCQGYGYVSKCIVCAGCGLKDGAKCQGCFGSGLVADKRVARVT